MDFLLTLTSVGILLLYAVPGFILSKAKAVKTDSLPGFFKSINVRMPTLSYVVYV